MMLSKKITGIAIGLITATSICVAAAVGSSPFNNVFATTRGNGNLVCGDYETNLDWNISRSEIVDLVVDKVADNYATLSTNDADLIATSSIISSIVVTKAQYYKQESGKTETNSLKFGTSSVKGSIKFVLTKDIDAIGFYADAYENTSDKNGKTLNVNGITTKTLGASYVYDLNNTNQRFFVEFAEATNEITIEASAFSSNRFHLYSIGFYSKNNFPDHNNSGGGGESDEPNSVTFNPTTQLTATSNGITWTNSSNYGTTVVTELRIYKGQTLTFTSSVVTMTSIILTCTANGTTKQGPGCFGEGAPSGYTFESNGPTGTWTGSATSLIFTATDNQVRITQIVVTYE